MGVELKPCPFCGGTAHVEQPGTRRQSCVVECDSCGIRHESGDEGSMCGTAWNRREGEAARIQQQALNYESLLAQHTESLERIDELELKAKRSISLQAQCDEHLARIADLEADRDCWRDQCSQRVADWDEVRKERDALKADAERLNAIINTPQSGDFLRAVSIEAEHQRQRWGSSHDAGKAPADWFWLVGYLGGKALHAHAAGNIEKAEHHIITTAAACENWHKNMFGKTDMRPGIDGETALQAEKETR